MLSSRTVLGDISNRNIHSTANGLGKQQQIGAVQKTATVTLPALNNKIDHSHAHEQARQERNAMDITLEEQVTEMHITPPSTTLPSFHLASNAASSAYAPLPAIDESDKLNAQLCSEYAQEILAYWRASETKKAPNANYMARQTDINPKMREILVDWLVEVQLKFRLKQETLFLAIHILDRFLERRAVTRTKLQLTGCTALLLAAKYEEIYAPEVNDFVCICDKAYTREQILAMEPIMLNALKFEITVPSPLNFLQRYARLAGVEKDSATWFLAAYYMELTLQHYSFLQFAPSMIAGSALFLAQSTVQQTSHIWSAQQQTEMNYTPNQLYGCIVELYKVVEATQSGASKHRAVLKKFSGPKFQEVAKRYMCRNPL